MSKKEEQIGILGVGKIGEALIAGIQRSPLVTRYKLNGSTRSAASAKQIADKYKISCGTDNVAVAKKSSILLLSVKPKQAEQVLKEIAPHLRKDQLLISVCASVSLSELEEWTAKRCPVIRSMPNTPCLIGEGITVLSHLAETASAEVERAVEIFSTVGKTAIIEESLMDGATGLSGCGPAYMFLILEALSEAGVKVGIRRDLSTTLAAQTMLGAAKMILERGVHPAALKDEVTTPAGCTIDGLMELEEGKIRVALMRAVLAATARSKKLQK